ncbi:MAG: lipid A biosynthesis lauroyl acyltransferase, partial [Nitratireductor sp.]
MASTAPDLTRRATIRATRALQKVNYWLIAKVTLGLLALLRRLPADSALAFLDRAARRIGPLAGRHRTALANLRAAYPDKTEDELQAIA